MTDRNPPGWGVDNPLAVLLSRVPGRYARFHDMRYLPDATELHTVTIIEYAEGAGPEDAGVMVFHTEGPRATVVAKLLVWLQREGL